MCNWLVMILTLIFISCSGEKKTQPQSNGTLSNANTSQNTGDTSLNTSNTSQNTGKDSGQKHWIFSVTFQKMEKGSFMMGSPVSEIMRSNDENQVPVEISRSFEIMTKEVTQSQWVRVMGNNPSYFKKDIHCDDHKHDMCPNHPVEQVSWNDVQDFIKKLNTALKLADCNGTPADGKGCYRLPTEAEWEYSARGGASTAYSFGADVSELKRYAWYKDNSKSRTHKVGLKKPNPKGLYDVHGNVLEWVQNGYTKKLPGGQDPLSISISSHNRVIRGGAWNRNVRRLRSAARLSSPHSFMHYNVGFRLVRTL